MALFERIFDDVKEPIRKEINEDLQFEITDDSEIEPRVEELLQAIKNKKWSRILLLKK